MAFKVEVITIKDGSFRREQIKFLNKLSAKQLEGIARLTERVIKEKVRGSIKRANSSGNLENNLFAERTTFGWGIGRIRLLNEVVPYWRHVNFGSQAIGASHSHRVPQGAFQPGIPDPQSNIDGSRWGVGAGTFSFIATKPIAPLNYIAKTIAQIPRITRAILSREVIL